MKISQQLEQKLSELLPLNHFLATGFSRNSLFLLIKACEWEKGSEIIIPAFTCPVISKTIELAGLVPVPVDSENDGVNIDPEPIYDLINEKTRAVYVVHTYGVPAKMDKIMAIARKKRLVVIEDLAHCLFSNYKGKPLGTFGDYAILSFTKKNINYEGGAIGTSHSAVFQKMVSLSTDYNSPRKSSLDDFIDKYVRVLGSWWEANFAFPALLLMKFNDFFNEILYKGGYGISVDDTRFFSGHLSSRLTLNQLPMLKSGKKAVDFVRYKEKFSNLIEITDVTGDGQNTLPAYYTGIVKKNNRFLNLLSFRTWHNINPPGKYPRADYLYANYRIFSKIIMLLR